MDLKVLIVFVHHQVEPLLKARPFYIRQLKSVLCLHQRDRLEFFLQNFSASNCRRDEEERDKLQLFLWRLLRGGLKTDREG
jgi:hypothetical protein